MEKKRASGRVWVFRSKSAADSVPFRPPPNSGVSWLGISGHFLKSGFIIREEVFNEKDTQ